MSLGLRRVLGLEGAYRARLYAEAPWAFLRQAALGGDADDRASFWNRWGFATPPAGRGPIIWINVLSGGEVMQIHSFVRHVRELVPNARVLVSSNNTYSCRVARAIPGVDQTVYCPWDLPHAARRALRRLNPAILVFVENLPFPVLAEQARGQGVPTLLCSGFMSLGFEQHETLARTMPRGAYRHLDVVGAKGKEDVAGFMAIGVDADRIVQVGNMRFDVAFHRLTPADREEWRRRLRLPAGHRVVVAGSVREGEQNIVLEAFARVRQARPDAILILAPSFRSPEFDTERAAASFGLRAWPRSRIGERERLDAEVLVLDSFGELSRVYGLADVIFMGGSIRPASHLSYGNNIVEPLIHGRPIFFGPHMNRWREFTEQLKLVYPGLEVGDADDLAAGIVEVMTRPELSSAIARRAEAIVTEHADAPLRNAELVRDVILARRPPRAE